MQKKDKLSKKMRAFVYYKARGYSNADSILKAGYKADTRIRASQYAAEIIHKPQIIEAIEKEITLIFDKSLITEEYVLDNLNDIAKNGKVEANRLQALKLLGQYKAMFTERTEIKGDMTLNPTQEKKIDEYINNRIMNTAKDVLSQS